MCHCQGRTFLRVRPLFEFRFGTLTHQFETTLFPGLFNQVNVYLLRMNDLNPIRDSCL